MIIALVSHIKKIKPLKIGLLINTPAQVHFWKFIVHGLRKHKHEVRILFRDRGETLELAKEVGLEGQVYATTPGGGISKLLSFPADVLSATSILNKFKPDLILDFGIYGVAVAKLLGTHSLVFTDSEPSINKICELQYQLLMPFVGNIFTPSFFRDDLGPKQIRINSYKELAYLHPNFFTPDVSVLKLLGLDVGDRFAVLRFNDLLGVHDIGVTGFNLLNKLELVRVLENEGLKVFISFEGNVPKNLEKYRLSLPKNRIHDLLFFAEILVTDTQTMATEAAILGTPVIRCNSFVGPNDMGNFIELEHKYGLIFNFNNINDVISKAKELIEYNDSKNIWAKKKGVMLQEKIDVANFLIDFIENYPASFNNK